MKRLHVRAPARCCRMRPEASVARGGPPPPLGLDATFAAPPRAGSKHRSDAPLSGVHVSSPTHPSAGWTGLAPSYRHQPRPHLHRRPIPQTLRDGVPPDSMAACWARPTSSTPDHVIPRTSEGHAVSSLSAQPGTPLWRDRRRGVMKKPRVQQTRGSLLDTDCWGTCLKGRRRPCLALLPGDSRPASPRSRKENTSPSPACGSRQTRRGSPAGSPWTSHGPGRSGSRRS